MKTKRSKTNDALLKTSLVLGSILATLFGGDLLAKQAAVEDALNASPPPQTIQITDPQPTYSADQPIVKLIIPDPVTRSQSSR